MTSPTSCPRTTPSQSYRIAVLMGGISHERPVSLSTGQAVTKALQRCGHDVHQIDIGPDPGTVISQLQKIAPHVVFNALHGPNGEDGHIQAVLDLLKLPYTHSGLLSSALAMDKSAMRMVLTSAQLPVAEGKLIDVADLIHGDPMIRPYVLKPVAEGSSFGVFILHPHQKDRHTPETEQMEAELAKAERADIAKNWTYGSKILVEEFIPGRELTVGVLEDKALAVTEILPDEKAAFYDYAAKYSAGGSRHIIPAQLPRTVTDKALSLAIQTHKALGCSGATRTDFRYDEQTDRLVILEINTQPGMTPTSLLPEQAAWCGMDYDELCRWMIEHALKVHSR